MTKLSEKYRIKNKSLEETREILFNLKKFPKSFSKTFNVKNIKTAGGLEVGTRVSMTLKKFNISAPCEYELVELTDNKLTYRQTCGLMKKWIHTMTLTEANAVVELVDDISYEVPYGLIGHLANDLFLKTEIPSMLYDRLKSLRLK